MTVKFKNFDYCYQRAGKPIFAPSDIGRRIGADIKHQVEAAHNFPAYYYHVHRGGHISALHSHRRNRYFCKIDLQNFFYSCGRLRVARALRDIGIERSHSYAKWSCVKNPLHAPPTYSLPYGFVQSPILATLTLERSPLGATLEELRSEVTVAIFVDDISLSSNNLTVLCSAFERLKASVVTSPFSINPLKTVSPTDCLEIFNCNLAHLSSFVAPDRIKTFYSDASRGKASIDGFERYCSKVES